MSKIKTKDKPVHVSAYSRIRNGRLEYVGDYYRSLPRR